MTNDDLTFTSKRVKSLRESMCLDITNFAVAIGVNRVTVWRWEAFGVTPHRLACEAMYREEEKLKAQLDTARA